MTALGWAAFVLTLQFVAVIGFAAQHSSGAPLPDCSAEAAGTWAASDAGC